MADGQQCGVRLCSGGVGTGGRVGDSEGREKAGQRLDAVAACGEAEQGGRQRCRLTLERSRVDLVGEGGGDGVAGCRQDSQTTAHHVVVIRGEAVAATDRRRPPSRECDDGGRVESGEQGREGWSSGLEPARDRRA